jgi:hypothetical protein
MEDFEITEDFAGTLETPAKAADAAKLPRTEDHRHGQRLGALKQWQARDRRAGVPPPVKSMRFPPAAKQTAIQKLLLMQRAESLHIKTALEEYVRRTIEELGGWENLTSGQKGMLICQKTCLLMVLACEDAIVDSKSLTNEAGKPHVLLSILRDFASSFRQGQVSLGLGLRSRMPRSPNETVQRIEAEYERKARPTIVKDGKSKVGKAG